MNEVTVRCAHESFPDRKFDFDPTWTVEHFKEEISQLYDQKPDPTKMRLICSGQLLQNASCLKDVLRSFGPDHRHVVHLVYTENLKNFTATKNFDSSGSIRRRHVQNVNTPSIATESSVHENVPSEASSTSGNFDAGFFAPSNMGHLMQQQTAASTASADPNFVLAYHQMQQMYSVYLNNYINYLSQMYGGVYLSQMGGMNPASLTAGGIAPMLPVQTPVQPVAEPVVPNMAAPGMPQNAGAAPQQEQVLNAQGGVDVAEEEMGERDWLDYVYIGCRAGVLLMVLYFYSSLERFAFVLLIFALAYAYQRGVFNYFVDRRRAQNRAMNEALLNQARAENQGNEQNGNEANGAARLGLRRLSDAPLPPEDRPGTSGSSGGDSSETEKKVDQVSQGNSVADSAELDATAPDVEYEPASSDEDPNDPAVYYRGMAPFEVFWRTCFTFITSFFTSLFPDRHQPAIAED